MTMSNENGVAATSHTAVHNKKNESILVGMRDGVSGNFALVPREQATVSVFDSNFLVGDGIWVCTSDWFF